ncbi:MAG: inositol monophosphatase [Betaproteobacteria bacterium]|nr:inositol monophosphatase [Betaproteobacteria bacterium]
MEFAYADGLAVAEILAEAARQEVMPLFNALTESAVRTKASASDLVTDADEAAEGRISVALGRAFRGAEIVGEEAVARDPGLLERLEHAELAFLVDPIDGTRNFVAGVPLFGVMAAAVVRGEIVLGVIHDPVARTSAIAVRDGGAWIEHADGRRDALAVAAPVDVGEMEIVAGPTYLAEPLRSVVSRNLRRFGGIVSFRCAAHEYRLAAAGDCHALAYNKLMPWDHAAGWLLHREAGGTSAFFDGSPYRVTRRTGGLLYAPDAASWNAVREALLGE